MGTKLGISVYSNHVRHQKILIITNISQYSEAINSINSFECCIFDISVFFTYRLSFDYLYKRQA